ncbi:MAG: LL-diaminopimelate aminotransferase [bacterium]
MAKLNENYLNLKESYLFADIAKRVNLFAEQNPDKKVIRLGIGDVTKPLNKTVIQNLHDAVDEMANEATFKGYGPEQGYAFLRESIQAYYKTKDISVDADEIFVTDGAKSDTGNITDLFAVDNIVLIPDPVYPVYVDTNIMNGRNIVYLDANKSNNFLPLPDESQQADLIYICSPNNPTGATYNKDQLKTWVDYAIKQNAIILFDSAYECFVSDDSLPTSIFAIEGAKKCAIEFCSLSKTAGFTGTRCGYTVVPKELIMKGSNGEEMSLNKMWNRRQTTKFNGVPYIIQKAADSVFSPEGMKMSKETIEYYKQNAKTISSTMEECGINYYGGVNSPYIWFECPDNMGSWDFFDKMLNDIAVVGTPGVGFGKNGDGYFRLSSFGSHENTAEAMERFKSAFKK